MPTTAVTPIQPLTGSFSQENFRQMIDHLLSFLPECPPQLAKRRLNARLRIAFDRRMWAGLLQRGQILCPAAYTTGTISPVNGSNVVTGSGTSWPVDDKVSTTLSVPITIAELQDIIPASMAGIELGDFLLIDGGTASEEVLLVSAVGTTTFQAKPTLTHTAGATITESSFVRRQLRRGMTTAFYSIRAVRSATALIIDLPWGFPASTGSTYQILKIYYAIEPGLRMVFSAVSHQQGWKLTQHLPRAVIDYFDAWRTNVGWSWALADYMPDEIGRQQYEVYPAPSTEQAFPYLAYGTPPDLEADTDYPPPCIPSHALVHGALSDLFLYNRRSNYYDPAAAQKFAVQFEQDLASAALVDDSVLLQNLQWSFSKYPYVQMGANWTQSHDAEW
jgi:hypothetical protein